MIFLLLLFLTSTAFYLGIYSGNLNISVFALELFGVYLLCCLIDVILILVSSGISARGRRKINLTNYPLTWFGRKFSMFREAVSYRINSLSDRVEQLSDVQEVKPPQPEADNIDSFLCQIIDELKSSFSPILSGIIIHDVQSGSWLSRFSGIRGKRIEEQIKRIYSGWLSSGKSEWFGMIDTLHHEFPGEDLAAYGIRYLIAAKVESSRGRGVLLLGYGFEHEPAEIIYKQLANYAVKLDREFGTFSSIQQLKSQVNSAEIASEARSQFITHVSHDIKSPLNNVKFILSLLREDFSANPDSCKLIETALANCDSLADLVDSLIDFARHRSGKLFAEKKVFDLCFLLTEIIRGFELSASVKGLKLIYTGAAAGAECFADKNHIRRIVSNIISNAIKYSASGTISVALHAAHNNLWSVSIRDSGPGLSDKQLQELFSPFQRFHQELAEGTGLGLVVSKILAELNGGNLKVASSPGSGSEFVFTVPAVEEKVIADNSNLNRIIEFPSTDSPNGDKEREINLNNLKILVIDDDKDCVQGLARLLAGKGADVAQASTVPDAMSIVNFDCPDVVITDAKMPQGGGARLLRFIRMKTLPAIVIVLSGDVSRAEEYIALGATCVMDKPVHISELMDYLEDILKNKERKKVIGE